MTMPSSSAEPIIVLDHLSKTFGSGVREISAVQDVSLTVLRGELFGVLGPNGAGKTTLMRLLSTLLTPTSGTAAVQGHDVVREPLRVRALLGVVASDERAFYGRLSARQNLHFYAALQGVPRREIGVTVERAMALFGLLGKADAPFQSLSTGQKQRLNMARALLHDPPILLLDEPTKSMDLQTADMVRVLVKDTLVGAQNKTVVFVSHELSEMDNFCTRVAILAGGRMQALGTPAELSELLPRRAIYRVKVVGEAARIAAHWRGLGCVVHVSEVAHGTTMTVFDVTLADETNDGWLSLVQAVAACDARMEAFRRLDEGSLRDVVRYFAADRPDSTTRPGDTT